MCSNVPKMFPWMRELIKAIGVPPRMAHLVAKDKANYIYLCDGVLPDSDELARRFPRRSTIPEPIPFHRWPQDQEERRAWVLALHVNQAAKRAGYRHDADHPRIESWIVGRPRGPPALFADWFAGQGDDYRLLVHRFPLPNPESLEARWRSHLCMEYALRRAGLRRTGKRPTSIHGPASQFISEVLRAYCQDDAHQIIPSLFDRTGHAYVRSMGPDIIYRRSRL